MTRVCYFLFLIFFSCNSFSQVVLKDIKFPQYLNILYPYSKKDNKKNVLYEYTFYDSQSQYLASIRHTDSVGSDYLPQYINLPFQDDLIAWYSSDSLFATNLAVDTLYDISGNGYHAAQANSSYRPTLDTANKLNGYNTIRFDSDNLKVGSMDLSSDSAVSIVSVVEKTEAGSLMRYYEHSTGGVFGGYFRGISTMEYSGELYTLHTDAGSLRSEVKMPSPPVDGGFMIVSAIHDRARASQEVSLFINGNSDGVGYSHDDDMDSTFSVEDFYIGGEYSQSTSRMLRGRLLELIVFSGALGDAERDSAEQYLRHKYAPPVNLGPDIAIDYGFKDTVIIGADKDWFVSHRWSTGITGDTLPTLTVNRPGTYTVTATDIFGYGSTDSINVTYPGNLSFNDTSICLYDTVIANTGLTQGNYDFNWSNGETSPSIGISSPGDYWVKITDTLGYSFVTDTFHEAIDSFPSGNYLPDSAWQCSGATIQVDSIPPGNITYLWNTGSTDSLTVVDTTGYYSLVMANENGCQAYDTTFVEITGTAPSVDFTVDTACFASPTSFTDLSTPVAPDTLSGWEWDFGDGTVDSLQNPQHTYNSVDTFTVTLTAYSGECYNTSVKEVVIKPVPQAGFGFQFHDTILCTGTAPTFENYSSPSLGDTLLYAWDFGDTTYSTEPIPAKTYNSQGNYNIQLVVTQQNGCSDTAVKEIHVTGSAVQPGMPQLVSPSPGAYTGNLSNSFTWNPSQNTLYYKFEIDSGGSFTDPATAFIDTTTYNYTAPSNGSYSWMVKSFNVCADSAVSGQRSLNIGMPFQDDVIAWYNSDSLFTTNLVVDTLYDISGNGYHATQANSSYRPTLDTANKLNGYNTIRFDSDNLKVGSMDLSNDSAVSIVSVVEKTEAGSLMRYYEHSTGGVFGGYFRGISTMEYSGELYTLHTDAGSLRSEVKMPSPPVDGGFMIVSAIHDRARASQEVSLFINGNSDGVTYSHDDDMDSTFSVEDFYIGGEYSQSTSRMLRGRLLELMVISGGLDEQQRDSIEMYLRYKYAPPVDLGPDIAINYGFKDTAITGAGKEWFVSHQWATGSPGDTLPVLTVNKTGTYKVTVTDIFGYESSDSINVTYPGNLSFNDTSICLYDTVIANTGLTQGNYDFNWPNGKTTPAIAITSPGDYWVEITDTLGYPVVTDTFHVAIDSFPSGNYLPDSTWQCSGATIQVDSIPTGNITYLWNTGSTDSLTVVDTTGYYSLVMANENGCQAYDTTFVEITGTAPSVDFTVDTACFASPTSFTDLSTPVAPDTLSGWEWDFGDGTVDSLQNPQHTYNSVDTFTVTLTAYSGECYNTAVKEVVIKPVPQAGFGFQFHDTILCTGTAPTFENYSSPALGDTLLYAWDFGDTTYSTDPIPAKTYNSQGNYNIQLVVTQQNGCSDTSVKEIHVTGSALQPGMPQLVSPSPGAYSGNLSNSFTWNPSQNTLYYKFEIDSGGSFTNPATAFIDTTTYNYTAPSNGSYSWRVKSFNVCADSAVSGQRSLNIGMPFQDDVIAWYNSDSLFTTNLVVDTLYDISGNGYHATQANSSYRPSLDTINKLNGYNTISFNYDNLKVNSMDLSNDSAVSIVSVTQKTGTSNGMRYYEHSSGGIFGTYFKGISALHYNGDFYSIHTSNNLRSEATLDYPARDTFMVVSAIHDRTKITQEVSLFINGKNEGITYSHDDNMDSTFSVEDFYIGGEYSQSSGDMLRGRLLELMVIPGSLDEQQRDSIEMYLRYKYAPPVDLGPDIAINYGFKDTTITGASKGWFVSHHWSTGSPGDTLPVLTVNKTGTYKVTVTDIFGYESSDSINVTYPGNLSFNDTSICLYDTVIANTGLTQGNYDFNWPNGETTPAIAITSPGDYWVEITDTLGYPVVTDTFHVAIDSFPAGNYLPDSAWQCSGATIQVDSIPTGNITYLWNTGSTDSLTVVDTTGFYSLVMANENGCQAYDTTFVEITGTAPSVDFTADTACFRSPTSFTDLSTPVAPYTLTGWEWDFGDGTVDSLQNPQHTYNWVDTFTVTLTAYSGECYNTAVKEVTIKPVPQAGFGFQFHDTILCTGIAPTFENYSSPALGDTLLYAWDFGDTTYSNEPIPAKTYNSQGNYNIQLVVTQQNGCSDTAVKEIHVTGSAVQPGMPQLVSPSPGAYSGNLSNSFTWNPSQNTLYYKFEIDSGGSFTDPATAFIDTTTYNYTAPSNGSYSWRVKSFNVCADSAVSGQRSLNIGMPFQDDVIAWYNSDSLFTTNLVVDTLYDISGNGYHATQANSSYRPSLDTISKLNGYNTISFNYDNLKVNSMDLSNDSAVSIVSVIQKTGTSNGMRYYEHSSGGIFGTYFKGISALHYNGDFYSLHTSNNLRSEATLDYPARDTFMVVSAIHDRTEITQEVSLFINGKNEGITYSYDDNMDSTFSVEDFYIGGEYSQSTSRMLKGRLLELMVIPGSIDSIARDSIQQYLRYKYAPPVNLGPDRKYAYDLCADTIDAGERFVSYLWSTGDTTQTIAVNEDGTYWVEVTDIFGFGSSDTVEVEFRSTGFADTAICLGDTAAYTVPLTGEYTYLWHDGSDDTTKYFTEEGIKWVRVQDTLGCFITDTFYVDVDSFAVEASLGPDRDMCTGDHLTLNTGSQNAFTYLWSDGSTQPYLLIEEAGTYWLTTTSFNGCVATDTIEIGIKGARPEALFTADSACIGNPTHFTDMSLINGTAPINSWQWAFNGQVSSTLQNPEYTFEEAGYYPVFLEVTTEVGCSDTIVDSITVYSYPEPDFMPLTGCSNVEIQFNDLSTNEIGAITAWNWNFDDPASGNSNTSELQNPTHLFEQAGDYSVNLISTNEAGCANTMINTVEIRPSPEVNFTYNEACIGEYVFFTDSTITEPWNQVISRSWYFGDGDSSTAVSPQHLYDTTGTYMATYRVKSLNGCEASISKPVTVHHLPQADFEQTDICLNQPYYFVDNSTVINDEIVYWLWKINADEYLAGMQPEYVFTDTGKVTVSLTVKTDAGCIDSIEQQMVVYPVPSAGFSYYPEHAMAPVEIDFSNESIDADSYIWYFGDGSEPGYGANPEHYYEVNDIYTVKLISFNEFGCTDTAQKELKLIPTEADIAVIGLTKEIQGDYLSLSATFANLGTRSISNAYFMAKANGETLLREEWAGLLQPGNQNIYDFVADIDISSWDINYVCVEASIPGLEEDADPGNNEICISLIDGFKLFDIYPNPADNKIKVDYSLPYEGKVEIILYDTYGNKVRELFKGTKEKGLNTDVYYLYGIRAGVYALKMTYNDNVEIRKFVKH